MDHFEMQKYTVVFYVNCEQYIYDGSYMLIALIKFQRKSITIVQ